MFTSCSDEVSLVYPGEAIPVIYGIFDASDTAHSIKVTKSFSGEEDAMKLMQNPGNLYYNSPEISLAQTGSNLDIQFLESPSHRNEGVFPESPNPVYSLKRGLKEIIMYHNENYIKISKKNLTYENKYLKK